MFLFTTAESRPTPPANPVVDAIREGAEKTGVGFDYLLATARRESALDPGARARTSSATGLFQFIEQTWLGVMKQDGPGLGLQAYADAITRAPDGRYQVADAGERQGILGLREDPKVATLMAGALTQRNRDQLAGALGREPSRGDLYAAHVLGPSGAADLIRMAGEAPGRSAAARFPEAAAANRGLFYDRAGRTRGAGEVYAVLAASQAAKAGPSGAAEGAAQAASAVSPERPVAPSAGPALHGLFRTEGRAGPISDAVARVWRTGGGAETRTALAYFPRSANPASETVADAQQTAAAEVDAAASPAASAPPLPPQRPAGLGGETRRGAAGQPLDLSAFMKRRKA